MAVISGVLKGPMGDARVGVVIELRAVRTSATVVIQARSQSVTDATGRYTLSVEPGQYDVMITAAGRQPERVGGIQVMVNSSTGTLNDFLTIPGETDLNPAIVATVDGMRAAAAASAAAAKTSENNAAATLTNSVKRGEFGIGGAALPYSGSIDDVTIATGMYLALSSSTGTKPPGSPTGHLTVSREGATGTTVNQKWVANNDDTLYIRRFYPGGWSTWKKSWNDGSLQNPAIYGLGIAYTPTVTDLSAQLTNQWWHASGISTAPNTGLWAGISGGYGAASRWNMAIFQEGMTVDFRVQVLQSGTAGDWAKVWHTLNTTVDANGFIKKASPIVKLFTDGSSELNGESQGVTTERVSEGVYRVSGTLGFNSDAEWGGVDGGIEIPIDRNKLPLVWVDYEVDETGDLLIKTFHRVNSTAPKFAQNVKVGYKEGQPIDIPAGRWIDLRVEMPGGDEPEYEPEGGEEQAPGETPAPIEEPKE